MTARRESDFLLRNCYGYFYPLEIVLGSMKGIFVSIAEVGCNNRVYQKRDEPPRCHDHLKAVK